MMSKRIKILIGINLGLLLAVFLTRDPFGIFETSFEESDPIFAKLGEDPGEVVDRIKITHLGSPEPALGKPFYLEKKGKDDWQISRGRPENQAYTVDFKSRLRPFLNKLKEARKFILVSSRKESQATTQTGENSGRINVQLFAPAGKDGQGGDKPVYEFFVGSTSPGGSQTHIRLKGDDEIWAVNGDYNNLLKWKLPEWRDRSIFRGGIPAAQVTEAFVTPLMDYSVFRAKKEGNGWQMTQPEKTTIDEGKILKWVNDLGSLKGQKIIMGKKAREKWLPKRKNPMARIMVRKGDRAQGLFVLGAAYNNPKDGKKTVKHFFVTDGTARDLYTLSPGQVRKFYKRAADLKAKAGPKGQAAPPGGPLVPPQ